jgi:hypothetical protein
MSIRQPTRAPVLQAPGRLYSTRCALEQKAWRMYRNCAAAMQHSFSPVSSVRIICRASAFRCWFNLFVNRSYFAMHPWQARFVMDLPLLKSAREMPAQAYVTQHFGKIHCDKSFFHISNFISILWKSHHKRYQLLQFSVPFMFCPFPNHRPKSCTSSNNKIINMAE